MSKRLASLSEAPDWVIDCRDLGHAWSRVTDNVTVGTKNDVIEFVRTDRCIRCATERLRTIEVGSWQIVKSLMRYPNNYLMAKGVSAKRTDVRKHYFERMMNEREKETQ